MLRGLKAQRSWGTLGMLLGHSWAVLGPSWGLLDRYDEKTYRLNKFSDDLGLVFVGLLGASWRPLGELLGSSCGPAVAQ